MSKYIDADHLKVEIEKHIKEVKDAAKRFTPNMGFFDAKLSGIYDVMAIIDSLQQEQLPGIEENGVPGKDFIPVEWVDALDKYGKWKIVQQEQPEPSNNLVDVDAVREDFITEVYRVLDADSTNDRANAIIEAFDSLPTVSQKQPEVDLEKAARHVYESWMGGTMDDVRRDMVELGKVLNAGKEESK